MSGLLTFVCISGPKRKATDRVGGSEGLGAKVKRPRVGLIFLVFFYFRGDRLNGSGVYSNETSPPAGG